MADEVENQEAAAPAAAKEKGGGGGMMPALLIIVLMPVVSFAMFKFLFIPMIKAEIQDKGDVADEITAEDIEHKVSSGDPEYKIEIEPVTANLKGTVQTRFIRVAVTLRSSDPEIQTIMDTNGDRIKEVIDNVIRNLTLPQLEKPEIKNVVRNQMKQGFEHALKKQLVEEINITEFVVQ